VAVLRVADTRRALLAMASAWRDVLCAHGTRVIAIAGSNGKTTAKQLVHAGLGVSLAGTAAPASFNNEIGVPMTLLGTTPGEAYVVCEIGTNAPGEIGMLAGVARPEVAVVTSLGREHLEGLGGMEGVVREELSILGHVRDGGLVVLPGEFGCSSGEGGVDAGAVSRLVDEMVRSSDVMKRGLKVARFGWGDGCAVRVVGAAHERGGDEVWRLRVSLRRDVVDGTCAITDVCAPVVGKHNALNVACALAVCDWMGVDERVSAEGMKHAEAAPMRLAVREVCGGLVLDDSYNANPESVAAGLAVLLDLGRGCARRVAVLGDMLEMGESSRGAHEELGDALAGMMSGCDGVMARDDGGAVAGAVLDGVVLIGGAMCWAGDRLARRGVGGDRVARFATSEDAAAWVRGAGCCGWGGAGVLLKGSRGMRLEVVRDAVAEVMAVRTGDGEVHAGRGESCGDRVPVVCSGMRGGVRGRIGGGEP